MIVQVKTRFWNFDKGSAGSTTMVPLLGMCEPVSHHRHCASRDWPGDIAGEHSDCGKTCTDVPVSAVAIAVHIRGQLLDHPHLSPVHDVIAMVPCLINLCTESNS